MSVEDKYANTVAIVYPAVAPGEEYDLPIDREIEPHITINVLGEIPAIKFCEEYLIAELGNVSWQEVREATVLRLAIFGPEKDFLVMELESPAFQHNWVQANVILSELGLPALNKFPTYRPHLTLQHNYNDILPDSLTLPKKVQVSSPTLWWGRSSTPLA